MKMGDPHPTDKNLVYYWKRNGKEIWTTREKLDKWQRKDKVYSIYYLPKENYCGASKRLLGRLQDHKRRGQNIEGYIILATAKTKRKALDLEKHYQLTFGYNGYSFGEKFRTESAERLKRFGHERIYNKKKRKVVCINTGVVYESISECARQHKKDKHSLIKHLNGEQKTFDKQTFKYHE